MTKVLLLTLCIWGALFVAAQPIITSIDVTPADCPSNGTMQINATGDMPLSYTLLSGPVCPGFSYPLDQGTVSLFNDLCPGTYSVRVTDANGLSTDQGGVLIVDDYIDFTNTNVDITLNHPQCGGDGSIDVTTAAGKPPYQFTLSGGTLGAPVIIPNSAGTESFPGLGDGSYTMEIIDACNSIQTRDPLVLATEVTPLIVNFLDFRQPTITTCGNAEYSASVFFQGLTGVPPYDWVVRDASNNVVATLTDVRNSFESFDLPIANDPYTFEVTDSCGTVMSDSGIWDDELNVFTFEEGCTEFDVIAGDWETCGPADGMTLITFTPVGGGTPVVVDLTNQSNRVTLPNGSYNWQFTNSCGDVKNGTVTHIAETNEIVGKIEDLSTCVGYGTGGVTMRQMALNLPWQWEIISYPPGYDQDPNAVLSGTWTATTSRSIVTKFLREGSYTFQVTDACGNVSTEVVNITEVTTVDVEISAFADCPSVGQVGFVTYDATSNRSSFPTGRLELLNDQGQLVTFINGFPALTQNPSGMWGNLPPGDYTVRWGDALPACGDVPVDFGTVTVPDYVQPSFDPVFAVPCTDGSVSIIGSGVGGKPPYDIEVYELGNPTLIDSRNDVIDFEFNGLTPGITYEIQIQDQCPNGTSVTVSSEAALPLTISTVCDGAGVLDLVVNNLSGVNYEWTKDGDPTVLSTTRFLSLSDPITAAEAGTYTVTATLGSCRNDQEQITLLAGETCTGTVTGHIYEDTNGNGVQDAGEPNLSGVDVLITDANGNTQTVTTDANGDWIATVIPGSGTADVVEATLPTGFIQSEGTDPTGFNAVAGVNVDGGIDGYFKDVELTPLFVIDDSTFDMGQERDAIYSITNIGSAASAEGMQFLITKTTHPPFELTIDPTATSAFVFGGSIPVSNSSFTYQDLGGFILLTMNPGLTLASGASIEIGVQLKATGTSTSTAQTTGQIVDFTACDQRLDNNFAQGTFTINIP